MTGVGLKVKFTYQDYLHIPEDKRYELMEGDFFVVPSPNESHQCVSAELGYVLQSYVKKQKTGFVYYAPFDVVLSDVDGYRKTGTYNVNTPLISPLLKDLTIDLKSVFYEM